MEAPKLHLSVDYVGTSGIILSPEQKASLQTSLTILQNNQKFACVYFWGKILGVKDDYFIAQGVSDDEFKERKVLYRWDNNRWHINRSNIKTKIIEILLHVYISTFYFFGGIYLF